MLLSLETLRQFTVKAGDGEIGTIDDVYFDDRSSAVRYVVVDTGTWLSGRKVLLAPDAFERLEPDRHRAVTGLSGEQVRQSPEVSTHRPLSRQMEEALHEHFGWAPYWGTGAMAPVAIPWGVMPVPTEPAGKGAVERELEARQRGEDDPHLRSAREVQGYTIHATDGDIGSVADLLLDETGSRIRYLVVDTGHWLPGRKVLVAVRWIREVDWADSTIVTDLGKEQVRSSPGYDPAQLAGTEYEARLWSHYGRTPYW